MNGIDGALERFLAAREELKKELESIDQQILDLKIRRDAIYSQLGVTPNGNIVRRAKPDPAFIAEMIRRRIELRMSRKDLARASGFSQSYISMLENETRPPTNQVKGRIRSALTRIEEESQPYSSGR